LNILIVCAGNTCRSPMAAGVLRKTAQELDIQVSVRTAGLAHHPNAPVAAEAVKVMREIGVDISDDYSKPVTDAALQWAEIVIGLQRSHLEYLAEEYPSVVGKLRYLGHDVRDPYKGALEIYRATRDELDKTFRAEAKRLLTT
jgi:protein arginine phosphatase